jgi:hypothetical protein
LAAGAGGCEAVCNLPISPQADKAIAAPSKTDAAENRRLIRLSRRPVLSETVVTFSAS